MALDILIVDDEEDIRFVLSGALADHGYDIREASTSNEALMEVKKRKPSLLIIDVWLEGSQMDGMELLRYLKSLDPQLPAIIISGHGNIEMAKTALSEGASDFLEKPFNTTRLVSAVDNALELASLRRENEVLNARDYFGNELVGRCHATVSLRSKIEKIAPTNSRALITGPVGSGKEVVAKEIHKKSQRKNGPFIVLNAALISPEQMDAELFGEEDATGRPSKIGYFERAHKGTLLLDEIGDMPIATQNKILRVLTEKRFTRSHGREAVEVDVRVLSTTSRNLESEVEKGDFRSDLYYRLNVVEVATPSLNDRREDIPELVEALSARIASALKIPQQRFTQEALLTLQMAHWSGNVRQLKNFVERMLIMSSKADQAPIGTNDIPREILASDHHTAPKFTESVYSTLSLKDARQAFEREYLKLQVDRFSGNISKTAQFVGMERSALHRKLKALGI